MSKHITLGNPSDWTMPTHRITEKATLKLSWVQFSLQQVLYVRSLLTSAETRSQMFSREYSALLNAITRRFFLANIILQQLTLKKF